MKKLRIISTIEARINSTRLPGKVMKKTNGLPMIELLVSRVRRSKLVDNIIVATSKNKSDDVLVKFLKSKKIPYYRGSENNVLQRVLEAAKKYKADIIVQLTGDNPLVDPEIIDHMLKFYLNKYPHLSYLTNNGFGIFSNRTVPYGMDVQIYKLEDLINNYKNSFKKDLKEHPSLYFYREGKKKYNIKNLKMPKKWTTNLPLRLTVDTLEDHSLINIIFEKLGGKKNIFFSFKKILNFFENNKKLIKINKNIKQKGVNLTKF